MTLRKVKTLTLAALTGLTLFSVPAFAGHGYHGGNGDNGHYQREGRGYHHGGHGHMDRHTGCGMTGRGLYRGLDLTEAQRSEIKALKQAQRKAFQADRPDADERQHHRQQWQALITAPQFDQQQAEQLLAQHNQYRQQHALARLETQNKIFNLLTPEQQQIVKQRMEHCPNRSKKS